MSVSFTDFNIIDHTGNKSLSGYALSATPLLFFPTSNLFNDNNVRVVWNFGDGTISKTVSSYHYYKFPGKYNVEMVIFDCNNNALVSTFKKTIAIYDYIPLTFNISIDDSDPLVFLAGKVSGPIRFKSFYPVYQPAINIHYNVKGSESLNYWEISDQKYAHLQKTYVFYDLFYNNYIKQYQYREIDKIEPSNSTNIYAKLVDNDIQICKETDSGSFFVGISSTMDIYFRDDSPNDLLEIDFYFDKTGYYNPYTDQTVKYLNNLNISLSSTVVDNIPSYLSVTSNGLDGEGISIISFDINSVKFFETHIPFVVKLKDYEKFNLKTFDNIQLSSLSIKVLYDNGVLPQSAYTIYDLNDTLSTAHGGSFRGSIKFNDSENILSNVSLSISTTLVKNTSSYPLTGTSGIFSVFYNNYYDFYKINEDFNTKDTIKSLIFQEILIDKNIFFDNFIGGVLGDDNFDHEDIGLKIYEKISNFISNTQYLDTCEIDFLNSLCQYIGYNDINEERYQYPERIKRLMNLLSINKNKLFGAVNKFNQDFNTRGQVSKTFYGKNLGDKIDNLNTYTVSVGRHLVALEKFSNEYTLINTYQPISATGTSLYPLSSYTSDWGWPLVLPSPFTFTDMEKYYLFFEAISTYEGSIVDGVIDFNNDYTTISYNLSNIDVVYNNILLDTLYQSLSLINQ